MFKKTLTVAAGVAGYVLGARAGRERYEQIKEQAGRLANNPKVKQVASDAQEAMAEKAPVLKDKIAGAGRTSDGAGSSGVNDLPGTVENPATSSTAHA